MRDRSDKRRNKKSGDCLDHMKFRFVSRVEWPLKALDNSYRAGPTQKNGNGTLYTYLLD